MTWEEALLDTAAEFRGQPPAFGTYDCCQFARSYYRRLTGRDVGAIPYATEGEARRILARHGGLEGLIEDILGEPADHARPGDVVLVRLGDGISAAGVNAGYAAFTIHPVDGLVRVDSRHILESWQCLKA